QASLEEVRIRGPADATAKKSEPGALAEGQFGKALDPRRAQQVTADAKPAHQKPPLTVECWAKLESKKGFNILVANNVKESGDHWEVYTYAGSGEFSAYLPGHTPAEIRSGVDVTDGNWHYLAMTLDAGRVRLYVDARLVKDVAVTRQRDGGAPGSLFLGGYPPQSIGCDGLLDEVRLSDVVRKIEQVPDAPFTADEHTIGLWHFDSAEEGRFLDSAGTQDPAALEKLRQQTANVLKELGQQEAELAAHAVP